MEFPVQFKTTIGQSRILSPYDFEQWFCEKQMAAQNAWCAYYQLT
jgi:hypothetical protein